MQSGIPAHKIIPGTSITVDGFRHVQPWVKAYFLSHAHSDHYGGITENWSAGPIYCSPVTAALAQQLTGVAAAFLRPLELNTAHTVEGVRVVLVDANHCPGAVQLLFELQDGRHYIHCGDMRYCPEMKLDKQLAKFMGADAVFLDTTYCHPKHTFPRQEEAVEFVASCIYQLLQEDAAAQHDSGAAADSTQEQSQAQAVAGDASQQRQKQEPSGVQQQQQQINGQQQQQQQLDGTAQAQQQKLQAVTAPACIGALSCPGQAGFKRLYVISTYVIGKERLLLAVAQRTGRRLLVTQRKMDLLRCIGLSEVQLSCCFTTDPSESPIHVVSWGCLGDTWPFFRPNYTNMETARQAAGAQEVVGFVPTGWMYEMKQQAYPKRSKGPCSVCLVPYSEHSSYTELREYVAWLKPKQIIPTVGVSEPGPAGDKARAALLQHFRGLMDETYNKAAFLARMGSAGRATTRAAAAAVAAADADTAATAVDDDTDVMLLNCCDNGEDDSVVEAVSECARGSEDHSGRRVGEGQAVTAALTSSVSATAMHGAAEPVNGGSAIAAVQARPVSPPTAAHANSAAAVPGVAVLIAIAGPELTAAKAQQLLAAAAGDVNAAVNAFLDKQANQQQQRKEVGSTGSKRQANAAGHGGGGSSKRSRKQASSGTPPAAGQAAITSFFSPRAAAKFVALEQETQQQDSQQQHQHQQGNSRALPQPPTPAAAAGRRTGIVLPPLHRRLAAPAPAPGGTSSKVAPGPSSQPVAPHVDQAGAAAAPSTLVQQQQLQQASIDHECNGSPSAPAAEAGTLVGKGMQKVAAAAATAAQNQAPSPRQQQQQWSLQSSKQVNPQTSSSSTPAPAAAAEPPACLQQQADAPPTDTAAACNAAPAGGQVHQCSSSSRLLGSKGGGKELTPALRAAPLLPLSKYHPVQHACWDPGQQAPYLALALTLAAIDGTSSRLLIADGLTNMFRSLMLLAPEQVTAAAYLICGKIAPEYVPGAELSVGGGVVSSALSEVCGISRAQLRGMYHTYGDLGDLAQACRRRQSLMVPPPPLTVQGVFAALHTLAAQSGQGATGRRQATIAKLLRCCRDVETKYLVRTLICNLRVGAAWKSVLGPLAKAALLHRKMLQEAGLLQTLSPAAAAAGEFEQQEQQQGNIAPASGGAAARCKDSTGTAAFAAAAALHASSSALQVSKQQLEAAAAAAAAAYHTCPNLGIIVDVLMSEGPEALARRVQLTCGVPVKPMLAKGCTSVAESFRQLAATAATALAAVAGGVAAGKGSRKKSAIAAAAAADKAITSGTEAAAAAAAATVVAEAVAAGSGVLSGADSGDESSDDAAEAAEAHQAYDLEPPLMPLSIKDAPPSAAASPAAGSPSSLCVLAEYKYDGQRAQIHVGADRQVHIFSRNGEGRTASFPDVVQAMLAAAAPDQLPLVIDAELVAVDRAHGNRVRAFQELATRPRTSASAAAVAVTGAGSIAAVTAPAGGGSGGGIKRNGKQSHDGSTAQWKQQQLSYRGAAGAGAASASPSTAAAASAQPEELAEQPTRLDAADAQQQQEVSKQQQQQSSAGVEVCVFAFDALCAAGRDLMSLSLRERRHALTAALPGMSPGLVQLAEGVELQVSTTAAAAGTSDAATAAAVASGDAAAAVDVGSAPAAISPEDTFLAADASSAAGSAATATVRPAAAAAPAAESVLSAEAAGMEFFHTALAAGGSVYQPAKRGLSWVKLKRDYLEGLADSMDLVPIGAWRGQGRKVQWFSPFLLAVYDPDTEAYQSLCRCMSGFTDEFYAAATERLGATVIPGPKQYYDTNERPDVWFEPTEVWEIRGADITISPVHRAAAGLVDPDRGLGLRFPRFMRLRPDKKPEEASGPDTVQHMYNQQHRRVRRDEQV